MNREDYIPPYSKQFAYRVNKIKEMRDQLNTAHKNDLVLARESGSLLTMTADESKLYHGNRTFGLIRPLSVGRNRDNHQSSVASSVENNNLQSNGRAKRSQSVERYRGRNDLSTSTSTSLTSRNAIEFNKALQLNRDIAAEQKLRESLLQVKKEAYVKYLRAKIDHKKPSWIPSGDGAKHTESMHTSINRSGLEKALVQKAWRRSPWPGLVTAASVQHASSLNTSVDVNSSFDTADERRGSKLSPSKRELHIEVNDQASLSSFEEPHRTQSPLRQQGDQSHQQHVLSSPSGKGNSLRVRAMSYDPAPNRRTPSSPMSMRSLGQQSRARSPALRTSASSTSLASVLPVTSSPLKRRGSASNLLQTHTPTFVALTVRLINASKSASTSKATASASNSYGILTVRASCAREEFIGAIERQFGVFDQISDISVASKYGYGGVLTFTSLSLGTLGERVELNDSSEVNVYLGGTLYQEGDNNDFLHFLEDELTHYEGKYSSYTQYTAAAVAASHGPQTRHPTQGGPRSSARRRPDESADIRSVSGNTTPRVGHDRSSNAVHANEETVRIKSGHGMASPRAIPAQNGSFRQAQLQQHVQSLGINRQFEQSNSNPSPSVDSPRHPFSRPTAQLPVPYNVTHSFDSEASDRRYASHNQLAELEEQEDNEEDFSQANTYDTECPEQDEGEEYLERTNYFDQGVRPQFAEEEPPRRDYEALLSRSARNEVDFTIADLMPSAQKTDPLTAAQRAFLSPAGKYKSPVEKQNHSDMFSSEDLTTPMPSGRGYSYLQPEITAPPQGSVQVFASENVNAESRRSATSRADAIHEKILHRVSTPTYKKPSSAAPPVPSDYSFQSAETAQALTHSKRGKSSVDLKASPVSRSKSQSHDEDDNYLLSRALNAKPAVSSAPIDRVAQFSYAALVSPSLLASSFHGASSRPFAGSSEETKSSVVPTAVDKSSHSDAPSDLVLNSYVQSILQQSDETTPEDSAPVARSSSTFARQQNTERASHRPLTDMFKSALSLTDKNRHTNHQSSKDVFHHESLTIETASPALRSSSHRGSGDSDDQSTYGSIVLSPGVSSPATLLARPQPAVDREAKAQEEEEEEEPERHMETVLLQYLAGHEEAVLTEVNRSVASRADPRLTRKDSQTSQEGADAPRSAVVTSFLEKVQQRRLAKQQVSSHQVLSINDLLSDDSDRFHQNTSSSSSSSSNISKRAPARAAPKKVHETFLDLADLMSSSDK